MSRLICLIFFCLLAGGAATAERVEEGNLVLQGVPEIPAALMEHLQRYQNVRAAAFADWTADGEAILVRTRFGNTTQLHRVDAPIGARRQLTFFEEPVSGGDVAPAGGPIGFLFSRDSGGDEFYRLYFQDLETGNAGAVSPAGGRVTTAIWSPDGRQIAYNLSALDSPLWRIAVAPADAPEQVRILHQGEGAWWPADFSADGRRLLLSQYISINESRLFVADLASDSVSEIPVAGAPVSIGDARFAVSGGDIFLTSDRDSEVLRLERFNPATGARRVLSAAAPWDVEGFDLSPDGRTIAYSLNEAGASRLYLITAEGERLAAPDLPPGLVSGLTFSPDGRRLAFTFQSPASPADVWVYELGTGALVRWTESEVGGLDTGRFVVPRLITYPTFDKVDGASREMSAFYYEPPGEGPHAVVIDIHGGPESQFRPHFRSLHQYWVSELGIAVLGPNVRGSSGYGKTFLTLDNGRLREDSVRDIGALLDWIAAEPSLDENRVLVYGGSYGGYMVLASLVHYSDRLAGGVSVVGISNFVTFLENTSDYRRDLRRVEYGDERDPEMRAFLEDIAPLNRAGEITQPLFLLQGLNDPRVPASESEQMLDAVRANDVPAWYFLATDEGHGFRKKVNRDRANAAITLFFQQVLLEADGPAN